MTTRILYDFMNEYPFGWIVAAYFFVASIASGLAIFTMSVTLFKLTKYQRLARITAFVTPFIAALVALTLIAELAQPARFIRVLFNFNPTSPISWGTWILNLFALISVAFAYAELKGLDSWKRPLSIIGVPIAALLPWYTAFELLMTRASPLWTSSLLPVIYLLSAGVAGMAVVLFISAVTRPDPVANVTFWLGRVGSHFVIYAFALLIIQVLVLFSRSTAAAVIGHNLVSGQYSTVFWGVVFVGGTLLPVLLLYFPTTGRTRVGQIVASLLILVGVFSQRALEIFAGMNFPH